MTTNPLTRARGVRLALLPLFVLAAGSCGGGDDVTGPPDDPSPVAVASVELAPASLNLKVGLSAQLTATPRGADGTPLADRSVTWATENAAIATVSATGSVTAVTTGEVRITATSGGKSGTATVTVSAEAVATVEVVPDPSSVTVGRTAQLVAVLKAASGKELPGRPVAWSSSDEAVATVSETGLVTGVSPGQATITATSEGKSGSSQLTVSAVSVASVEVSPPATSVAVGGTVQLTAAAKDADGQVLPGRPATWSSDKPGIAQVSATGPVTGVAAGEATITATIEGKTGTAKVTVTPAVGTVRSWKGGAAGKASDWSAAGNWNPSGAPAAIDTARVPATSHPAVVGTEMRIARLIVAGGRVRTAGHRLLVRAAQ